MVSSSGTESRRVTIHDVARSAGVSRQTVSRALNDKDEIDGATKQRVLDAARELGYRPSRFARGLVRQDTTTIGLVIPDLLNPFFTEVAAAALEAARARGWHVVVYDTADRAEEEFGTLQVIASQVDAVVGYFSCSEHDLERFTRGLPVVLIGREHPTGRFSSIRIDGEEGVQTAVAHLVAAGHRHIGMLDHDGRAEPSVRRDWFATAAAAHGIAPDRVVGAQQSADGGGRPSGSCSAPTPRSPRCSPSTTSSRSARCARPAGWAGASPRTSPWSASTACSSARSSNPRSPASRSTRAASARSPSTRSHAC